MLFSSPVLGMLSDRCGRRPVLLLSLCGTAFDDIVMALAPTLSILYLGRILAGFTGANLTVANAYIADTVPEEERSTAFGRMNACFGIGFIAGPILGGVVGAYSLRAPFYLAAALNGLGALVCLFALPESRRMAEGKRNPISLKQLNPFASVRCVSSLPGVTRLLYIFCTMEMVGQIPGVLWVIYGTTQFHWSAVTVGLSIALFGLLHALCQAFVPQIAQRRFGESGTVIVGMSADCAGFILFSIARTTFAVFSMIPLLCLSGVALPALQSMLSNSASEDRQGELQGVLTSFNSLVAIVGPIVASNLYELLRRRLPAYPGSIWLFTVLLYVPCFVVLFRNRQPERQL
jgi:DHA1 family tetracycline resistance protein-like MFS transporter